MKHLTAELQERVGTQESKSRKHVIDTRDNSGYDQQ